MKIMKMRILEKLSVGLALLLVSVQPALAATCTLNGQQVPCDDIPKFVWVIPIIIFVLGILFFIFWLRMLLDAIKHGKEDKTMWVLIIIFLNIPGSIIYYFAEKRKRK
ncbi:hypothetical protein HN358_02240 [Candidatus Uhrbacteria bacterium]|jgi:hypothetical protein|nr:hypothetical protein [Candidatus Uhrbacteria bacterium]MBT7717499.1 hypothetical protein [Candidatus Uhrbacteria bacterium]